MTAYQTLASPGAEIRLHFSPAFQTTVESGVYDQARATAATPGVQRVSLLPDTHVGAGAPIGSVISTRDTLMPGPVGYDISCGMLVLTTNLPAAAVADPDLRRELITSLEERIAMGEGQTTRNNPFSESDVLDLIERGARALACMGVIPPRWQGACEHAAHWVPGESGLDPLEIPDRARRGFHQMGTLGGGNHFLEIQRVHLPADPAARALAARWGLAEDQVVIMLHSGSRGFGHALGEWAFAAFKAHDLAAGAPITHPELVYAPAESAVGIQYLRYLAAGANYAVCNRLVMAAWVREAVQEVLPGTELELLYDVSHNLAAQEDHGGERFWVHRKGATRALPAGHPLLSGTPWAETGHPVITPGSMGDFSAIQVGLPGAADSAYSINHGAGRRLSRGAARRTLVQAQVNADLAAAGVTGNHLDVPLDEAPGAYKPLAEVLDAVQYAGLARPVAYCYPLVSLKGGMAPHRR